MTQHWIIWFWHGWNPNCAQEILDQFPDSEIVQPDDPHGSKYLRVYGSAEMVLSTLLELNQQVWFNSDQETVFITGHRNFGQR